MYRSQNQSVSVDTIKTNERKKQCFVNFAEKRQKTAPFSPYEKRQILKLVIAVIVFIAGCVIWAVGRNCPEYAVHAFLLIVILVAVLYLAVTVKIAKIRGEENDGRYWGDACLKKQVCVWLK